MVFAPSPSARASFVAVSGRTYRLKLSYKATEQGSGAKIILAISDKSGAVLESKGMALVTTSAGCSGSCCSDWVTATLPRVTGKDETFTVSLGLVSPAGNGSAVWFDDVAVEPYDGSSSDCVRYSTVDFNPWELRDADTGNLLYPPRTPQEAGPVSSLRWEMMRQGLEDLEYLRLLTQLVADRRGVAPAGQIEAAEAALKRLDELTSGLPFNGDLVIHTLDAALVDEVRAQIGRAIDALWAVAGGPREGSASDGSPGAKEGAGEGGSAAPIQGGCGCRVPGGAGGPWGLALAGLVALVALALLGRHRTKR